MADSRAVLDDGVRSTSCPLDCPDTCALEVEVRQGRVRAIRGRRDHPDTAGFICGKVAGFGRRLEHPERLLHPMRRVGAKGEGRFERLSWSAAIEEIASRYREIRRRWGGEAIVPFHYGGSNGVLTDGLLDTLFFHHLGASRLERTLCAAPTTEVALDMYGKMPGVAFADYPAARCIVIWGANPKASNIHLVPYLRAAKRNGAFIAAVDPRRNFSADEIDLHLPVRPGTDLPVALAMIELWRREGRLDRDFLAAAAVELEPLLAAASRWTPGAAAAVAGVEAVDVERLARVFADSSPAVVRCGWGLERNRNGGQAVAAVLALPALAGKFGRRGGGYTLSNNGAARVARERVLGTLDGGERRRLNMTQLGRWLRRTEPPPVKALFVYNCNPVATVPDQGAVIEGLSRADLHTVVFDQVMTDTARFADLLLPAVTFLEGHDLRVGYGSYVVGGVRPVVSPRGEARSNPRVFAELSRAMGFAHPALGWSEEEIFRRVAATVELSGRRPDVERLVEGGSESHDFPGAGPVQFESVFPRTADGKIHLTPGVLGPAPYLFQAPAAGPPLALITPASSKLISSTLGEYNYRRLELEIHPRDAAGRGLTGGDTVRVFNERGEVHCVARISDRVPPGVVSMPKGAWRRASLNGVTATALCPDHVNVVGGGACFNDARVDVERL